MKNKKKGVFLAGLMVLIMMVSLLSGINLGAAKAEETETKPNDLLKTFTLIKEWDAEPEEGTKAEFIMRAKYVDKNGEMTEVTPSSIVLTLDKGKSFYDTKASKNETKTIWTTEIPFVENFQGKPVTLTIEEKESKVYKSNPSTAQEISDKAEIKFTNTRVKKLLHIEKNWIGNEGEAVEFVINENENDVITLKKSDEGWKTTKSLPVYDLEGNAIKYKITERAIRGYTTDEATKKFELVDDKGNPADATVSFTNTAIPSSDSSTVVNDVISVPVSDTTPTTVTETTPVTDTTPVTIPDTTPTITVPEDNIPQGDANTNTSDDADNTDDGDDEAVVDVDEDDIPQGEAKVKKDTSKETPVKVEEDVTPKGSANLPKTGGTMGGFLSLLGMGLIGLGLAIRKRK